mmetsp:Transcript_472/g.1856  ORF Transcript_472/g.1856 Transcript_472/m.1856 type:complete len:203 (-) Transcript_472:2232-2840(-)
MGFEGNSQTTSRRWCGICSPRLRWSRSWTPSRREGDTPWRSTRCAPGSWRRRTRRGFTATTATMVTLIPTRRREKHGRLRKTPCSPPSTAADIVMPEYLQIFTKPGPKPKPGTKRKHCSWSSRGCGSPCWSARRSRRGARRGDWRRGSWRVKRGNQTTTTVARTRTTTNSYTATAGADPVCQHRELTRLPRKAPSLLTCSCR